MSMKIRKLFIKKIQDQLGGKIVIII